MQRLTDQFQKNVEFLNQKLGVGKSFDVICRQLQYAGKEFALYFVDGFAKDDVFNKIMTHLAELDREEIHGDLLIQLLKKEVAYLEVEKQQEVEKIITAVLSGQLAFVLEGESFAILVDARSYPARGPEEPDIERVIRGSRDGFVETLIFNTALTRRRLRDPSLRMEYLQIGKRSKTDIVLSYLEDVADPRIVNRLRDRIQSIDADGLPMAEKTMEEYLFGDLWNPYPMVRYTERPDVAAAHLLEGHVLLFVDTSPSVMILPTTFFHHLQHAEEYRQKPIIGVMLRWIRFLAVFASLFLLPAWYLAAIHPESLPQWLKIIGPEKMGQVPLILQILIGEIGVEILRMASIHTPSPLATAMGLIAAILLGETAVEVGLFTSEVILYVSIAVIGTFATPSYEMGIANKLVRLFFLAMSALLSWPGFFLAIALWVLYLARIESYHTPYLWPLVPFDAKAMWDVFIRTPMPLKTKRPRVLAPQDPDR